jgi:type IV pilus assembly protein PilE
MKLSRQRGFTLPEIMVAVAIVGITASVAIPMYSRYVVRGKVPQGLDTITATATRLEQYYQDHGHYGNNGTCANGAWAMPTTNNFTLSCAVTGAGQGFTLTLTGQSGSQMSGYTYTLDNLGTKRTLAHPVGVPAANCWSIKGSSCDAG